MSTGLTGFVLAIAGAYGVYLIWTAVVFGWRGLAPTATQASGGQRTSRRTRLEEYLVQAGVDRLGVKEFIAVSIGMFIIGSLIGLALFNGAAAMLVGLAAATVPIVSANNRRAKRLDKARDSWPRMIEEIRLQAVSLGRSIPQALFAVGDRAPEEMQSAFDAAHREWFISTDFDRTLAVLKAQLADPTADAVCETLLIAHEVGGTDVDRRLQALLEDRILDLQGRKDARARQAGARFARIFVLIVPLGMALVGQSIAAGRDAYQGTGPTIAITVALGIIAACWWWAGTLMQLPAEQRVFRDAEEAA